MSRKLRLLAAYVKGLPIWCSWQVTPRCASFCGFCEHRTEGAFEELDLASIERVSDELGRAGALMVSLSGGDPLLRQDLPQIVAAIARRHFPLVTTHGWQVTPEKARALWEAGLEAATVTLDHAFPEPQDAAAGQPGAHARALRGARGLRATRARAPPSRSTSRRGCARTPWTVFPPCSVWPRERGATVTVEPAYPLPGDLGPVGARLRELRGRHPSLRVGPFFLDRIEQALRGGVPGCQAGRAFFNVDERGRVSKCVEFRRPEDRAGDLSREPLPRGAPPAAPDPRRQRLPRLLDGLAGRGRGPLHRTRPAAGPAGPGARLSGRRACPVRRSAWLGALLGVLLQGAAAAQAPPEPGGDPGDLVNALLSGLLGFADATEADLQAEVAATGGVPFKAPVPLEYMGRGRAQAVRGLGLRRRVPGGPGGGRRAHPPGLRSPSSRDRSPGPARAGARGERGRASTTSVRTSGGSTW